MERTQLICGSCGAPANGAGHAALLKCEYCGTITITSGIEKRSTGELKDRLTERTRKIVTLTKKAANYMHDGVSDGGWLHVTKSELVFVPHMLNVTSGYRLVFPFDEIRDIRKHNDMLGFSRQLIVETADSAEAAFVMWGRDAVIKCIHKQL